MNTDSPTPNEQIASSIVHSMIGEVVLSSTRMATGDQNFVYAVKTPDTEYVLRMTNISHKKNFMQLLHGRKCYFLWEFLLLNLSNRI